MVSPDSSSRVSDELYDRRAPNAEMARWHKANSEKLDAILAAQRQGDIDRAVMLAKLNQICGEPGSPGRMRELEDRVNNLEDAKTFMWALGVIVGWLGLDRAFHFFTGK